MSGRDHGHHEPPWSVADQDREEARDASRFSLDSLRRVGDRWIDDPDMPDLHGWDEPE